MRTLLTAVLVGVLLVSAGCRPTKDPAPTLAARKPATSKVDYFKQSQAAGMTPHGSIDMSSVKETPDGVEYRTIDGKRWKVKMEPVGSEYRYHDVEEIAGR